MNLLFWQHPSEDLSALNDPIKEGSVVIADELESFPVAREHVVLVLDRAD